MKSWLKLKTLFRWAGLFLLVAGILSACNIGTPALVTPVSDTQGPSTDSIALTLTAFALPTATKAPTSTLVPVVYVTPTPQKARIPVTGTTVTSTPLSTPAPNLGPQSGCDRATLISDLTFADGTTVAPGANFVKSWRIKNSGTCEWKPGYTLVFAGNNPMGGPTSISLPNRAIVPGATVDISVTLKAPTVAGSYESDWLLRNLTGQLFGVGPNGNGFLWAKIIVPGNSQTLAFQPGETSAAVSGGVGANSTSSYLVNAVAGQKMIVSLNSPSQSLALEVLTPQGAFMVKAADKLTNWQADLPTSGNYLISVVNSGAAANFNLTITLPVRITFPAGMNALNLAGAIQPHSIHTYLLNALQKQTLTVTVQSDKNDVFLTIYGAADGNPYVRSATGQATFSLEVPSTQDYVIQCESTGDKAENYVVTFSVQ